MSEAMVVELTIPDPVAMEALGERLASFLRAGDLVLPEGFVFDEDAPDAVGHVLNRIALAVMEFRPTSFDFMPAREAVRAERERFASQVAAATTAVAADDTRLASTTR